MQHNNYMIENARKLELFIIASIQNEWSLSNFKYDPIDCYENEGPGLCCHIKHIKKGEEFTLFYPLRAYRNINDCINSFNADTVIVNIAVKYPQLKINGCEFSRNTIDIIHPYNSGESIKLKILDQCYDCTSGEFDIVKFQQLANHALNAMQLKPVVYRGISTFTAKAIPTIDINGLPEKITGIAFIDPNQFQNQSTMTNKR